MEIALQGRTPGGWTHRLQGFIFTALLSFGIQGSEAQVVTITPEPKSPVVGGAVNLTIPSYGVIRSVHWYRSKGDVTLDTSDGSLIVAYIPGGTPPQRPGPNSTRRETVLTDGSLQIKDLKTSDSGPYTVQMQVVAGPRTGSVYLRVSARQGPESQVIIITTEPKSPVVGGAVNLTIPFYGGIRSVHWYRSKGDVLLDTSDSSLIVAYIPGGTAPQRPGPNSTQRETVLIDGSLQIKDLLASDTGAYTVQMQLVGGPRTGSVDLKVSGLLLKSNLIAGASPMEEIFPNRPLTLALPVAVAVVLVAAVITITAVLLYKRLHRGTKSPPIHPPRRDRHHLNRSKSVNSDGYIDPKDIELPVPHYETVLPSLPNDQTSPPSDTGHVYEELQYADKNLYNSLPQ